MAEECVQRELAAILIVDVVGYSRLMRTDESGTLAQLRAIHRELIESSVAKWYGRIVKTTGDGILIEFSSAVVDRRSGDRMEPVGAGGRIPAIGPGKFGPASTSLQREFEGTGPGLPLVKAMAEPHGALLVIDSSVKGGTTAAIRFPIARVSRRAESHAA